MALAYRVGHAIETKGASRVKGAVVSDSCAKCEKCAEDLEEVWSNYGTATPTAAPTETRYWDLYWTDGAIPRFNAVKESYVWTTSNEWEDVHASVLVDTYGYARGVDVDLNGSVVYFTIDGCIGKVHKEGYDPGVLVCYENVTDTQMEGLAVYNWMNLLFWVDYKTGWLYAAQLHVYGRTMDDVPKSATVKGNGTYVELRRFRDPVDVAVDERAGHIYVSDADGIYKMDAALAHAAPFAAPSSSTFTPEEMLLRNTEQ